MTCAPVLLRRPVSPVPDSAFTLVELLLAVGLGSLMLTGVIALAVSMIRASAREEIAQTSQDAWSRVHQFLVTEVGEARRSYVGSVETVPIQLNAAISGCSGTPTPPSSSSFSIRVGNPANPAQAPTTIDYYVQNGNLMRCGLPVLADGTLNFSGTRSVAVLSYGTSLSSLDLAHSGRSIGYDITISSPQGSAVFTGRGRAWAQSAVIQAES